MKLFRKVSLLLPVLMLALLATQCATPECVEKSLLIKPNAFNAAIADNADALVLDVRTPEEFAEGHIDGATLIDFYSDDFEQQLEQLDKNGVVLLYCRSGGRSAKARSIMEKQCFKNIYELDGGFNAWSTKGMPSVK